MKATDHRIALTSSLFVFALGNVASGFGRNLTFYDQFTAGGLTQMDAYRYQELHGNSVLTAGGGRVRLPRPESQEQRFPPIPGELV